MKNLIPLLVAALLVAVIVGLFWTSFSESPSGSHRWIVMLVAVGVVLLFKPLGFAGGKRDNERE